VVSPEISKKPKLGSSGADPRVPRTRFGEGGRKKHRKHGKQGTLSRAATLCRAGRLTNDRRKGEKAKCRAARNLKGEKGDRKKEGSEGIKTILLFRSRDQERLRKHRKSLEGDSEREGRNGKVAHSTRNWTHDGSASVAKKCAGLKRSPKGREERRRDLTRVKENRERIGEKTRRKTGLN